MIIVLINLKFILTFVYHFISSHKIDESYLFNFKNFFTESRQYINFFILLYLSSKYPEHMVFFPKNKIYLILESGQRSQKKNDIKEQDNFSWDVCNQIQIKFVKTN